MKRWNLDEFIKHANKKVECGFSASLYVKEPGWKFLYVRLTWRYIKGKKVKSLDIANCEATHQGCGTFKKLLARIRNDYPTLMIYVESVFNEKFASGLLKLGFKKDPHIEKCYYLPAKECDGQAISHDF